MLASFSIELQGDEEERNEAVWFTSTPGGSCKVVAPQIVVTQPTFSPSKPTPGLSFSGASPFALKPHLFQFWTILGNDSIQK